MYAVVHVDSVRKIKNHPEVCTLLPNEVTEAVHHLRFNPELLDQEFRVVRTGPDGQVEQCCRADRWAEPRMDMKLL